ncbi:hypothetical protein OQA88_8749 [Cercophora sp. LCS_1]
MKTHRWDGPKAAGPKVAGGDWWRRQHLVGALAQPHRRRVPALGTFQTSIWASPRRRAATEEAKLGPVSSSFARFLITFPAAQPRWADENGANGPVTMRPGAAGPEGISAAANLCNPTAMHISKRALAALKRLTPPFTGVRGTTASSSFAPTTSTMPFRIRTSLQAVFCVAGLAPLAAADAASDLSAALADYPALTGLRDLVQQLPTVVNDIIGNNEQVTILAPSDFALETYTLDHNGTALANASQALITNILQYHILVTDLTSSNFSKGLTVPTLLEGELYNNRTPGVEFIATYGENAGGQVVYAHQEPDGSYGLQAQLGTVNLTTLNRRWPGGILQMVDRVLDLPQSCTSTMEDQPQLKTLSAALEDSGVYDAIDAMANVTCLGPSDEAFAAAGNPQNSLNKTEFNWLVRSHVIPQPLYLDHLRDGMELKSLRNNSIKVTLSGSDIFFNNAKVVKSNVITNNGLIYVLDRLMETGTPAAASPTGTPTPSKESSGNAMGMNWLVAGLAVAAGMVVGLC